MWRRRVEEARVRVGRRRRVGKWREGFVCSSPSLLGRSRDDGFVCSRPSLLGLVSSCHLLLLELELMLNLEVRLQTAVGNVKLCDHNLKLPTAVPVRLLEDANDLEVVPPHSLELRRVAVLQVLKLLAEAALQRIIALLAVDLLRRKPILEVGYLGSQTLRVGKAAGKTLLSISGSRLSCLALRIGTL